MHRRVEQWIDCPVEIIRKPVKHLYIRVTPPDGRVRITAPPRWTEREIDAFLAKKADWIAEARRKITARAARPENQPPDYRDGGVLYIWGNPRRLRMETEWQPPATGRSPAGALHVSPIGSELVVTGRQDRLDDSDQVRRVVEQWCLAQFYARVSSLLPECQAIVGKSAREWRVRAMRTRWGTCNAKAGRIWLNSGLVHREPDCLRYVVIHELTHLWEPSHNQRFYLLLDEFYPEWRAVRQKLRR